MIERHTPLDHIFSALADPTRRDMLRRLAERERTISELAAPCDMSFAAASKHVRMLERAGLIRRTVRGRTHHCRLEPAPLADAQAWLDALEEMFRPGKKE
jgi:DNA-binding transcriptional ArsR family regulator